MATLHHQIGEMSTALVADAARVDRKPRPSKAISVQKPRRTRSVFMRLTEEEYARLKHLAGDIKINVYARYALLKESRVLEELLALRMIVLNLSDAGRERVVQVKQQADAEKVKAAMELVK